MSELNFSGRQIQYEKYRYHKSSCLDDSMDLKPLISLVHYVYIQTGFRKQPQGIIITQENVMFYVKYFRYYY